MPFSVKGWEDIRQLVPTLKRRETDDAFIAAVYQTHKDKVYSIALHFFHGDTGVASDVTQQVFLKLITGIGQFRGEAAFSTWIYRMTVNTCIDASRRRKPEVPIDGLRLAATAESPADEWEHKQMAECVQAAVAALPEPFRMAVLLRHFEELSYEEIAGILECSMGTVASRLARAHRLLAETLAPVRGWFETRE